MHIVDLIRIAIPGSGRAMRAAASCLSMCLLISLAYPAYCKAESVSFWGQAFPVDEVVPIKPDQVKISIGGSTFIVAQRDAGKAVAFLYTRSVKLARSLPWARYIRFLGQVRGEQDRDILDAAAKTLLTAGELSVEEREDLIQALLQADVKGGVLLDGIASAGTSLLPAPVCMVIRSLGIEAQAALKERAPAVIDHHDSTCSKFFNTVALKALSEGRVDRAEHDLNLGLALSAFGHEADKSALIARNSLLDLQNALQEQDVLMYQLAFEKASAQPLISEAFKQGAPALVQDAAEKFLSGGDPGASLRLLTLLGFDRRTDATHDLVGKALSMLKPKDYAVFEVEDVRRLLSELAAKDDSIRQQLSAVLDVVVTSKLSEQDWSFVATAFDLLREIRPDPSEANDRHRFAWAEALLSSGTVDSALGILGGARSRIPVLLWARIYFRNYPMLVCSVLAVVVLFAIRVVRDFRVVREARKLAAQYALFTSEEELAREHGDELDDQHSFVRYSSDLRGGGIRDEYEDLLSIFGVEPGVQLKVIKNAYRNAVKTCHPDLKKNTTAVEADRFIHLTQAYDRLLRLHEERTGER